MYRSISSTPFLRVFQRAFHHQPPTFSLRPRKMAEQTPSILTLDGRTGEGGGQIIRLATCLSALTRTPVNITNVRGNRGKRGQHGVVKGDGLKAQHSSSVKALAQTSASTTENVVVGSTEFTFRPGNSVAIVSDSKATTTTDITIAAASAASATLVFQALFPYLIFSRSKTPLPIRLTIKGGTNVSFSPSFEYLDQVMLPMVESWFGVPSVKRTVSKRGWSHGAVVVGSIEFEFTPLAAGQTLRFNRKEDDERGWITKLAVTILVPETLRGAVGYALRQKLSQVLPGRPIEIVVDEATEHPSRIYVMVVAHSASGSRIATDCLYSKKTKNIKAETIAEGLAKEVANGLRREWERYGDVDGYLQDQLVVFQALAEGTSVVKRGKEGKEGGLCDSSANYSGTEPFGTGSDHAKTARWVADQFLRERGVVWSNNGEECTGVGWGKEDTEISR